jgi:hypothetical protein
MLFFPCSGVLEEHGKKASTPRLLQIQRDRESSARPPHLPMPLRPTASASASTRHRPRSRGGVSPPADHHCGRLRNDEPEMEMCEVEVTAASMLLRRPLPSPASATPSRCPLCSAPASNRGRGGCRRSRPQGPAAPPRRHSHASRGQAGARELLGRPGGGKGGVGGTAAEVGDGAAEGAGPSSMDDAWPWPTAARI